MQKTEISISISTVLVQWRTLIKNMYDIIVL